MKRLLLSIFILMITLIAKAEGYHYLTFEMVNGQKVSVPSSELVIAFHDGKLTTGGQTFEIANLKKMYFTLDDATTSIKSINHNAFDESTDVYDLNGKRIAKGEIRKGIYIIKGKDETYKMTVR